MLRLLLPFSADALFAEEAAMTVPVVADLDRVILRRGVEDGWGWAVVTDDVAISTSLCD